VLSEDARTDRYLAQTGRKKPTARQQRRIDQKKGHQAAAADKAVERDTKPATS
jgi:hypothetical protein